MIEIKPRGRELPRVRFSGEELWRGCRWLALVAFWWFVDESEGSTRCGWAR
jgi:hypothetical protein